MSEKLTPEQLYKFFLALDPGITEEEETEIQYGSPTVLRRGLLAAKMLLDVQEVLGVSIPVDAGGQDRPKAEVKELPLEQIEKFKATADALTVAEGEADRLLLQNIELKREKEEFNRENDLLKDRIKRLQKQVERLYNKSEMTNLLGRFDSPLPEKPTSPPPPKEESPGLSVPMPDQTASVSAEAAPANPAPSRPPRDESLSPEDEALMMSELADAGRVPKEEQEKKPAEGAETASPSASGK